MAHEPGTERRCWTFAEYPMCRCGRREDKRKRAGGAHAGDHQDGFDMRVDHRRFVCSVIDGVSKTWSARRAAVQGEEAGSNVTSGSETSPPAADFRVLTG
jgi:hypothetical protein